MLKIIAYLFIMMTLSSCYYQTPDCSAWDMPKVRRDSLTYLATYHITFNSNFEVTADSVALLEQFVEDDSSVVYHGDRLVIADFMVIPQDTIDSLWVKVAHDQFTMGWLRRSDLLSNVVPIDPISKFIYLFSGLRGMVSLIVVIAFLLLVLACIINKHRLRLTYYDDIDSIYPVLLSVLVACAATLYASMQLFVPETWQHYYYNPSLNPFVLPGILACFVCIFWAIIIVSVAVLDDVFHKTSLPTAFSYLLGLAALCIICYLFFTFMTLCYVGYFCLIVYLVFSGYWLYEHTGRHYLLCGNCGARLHRKGICSRCGAVNQ